MGGWVGVFFFFCLGRFGVPIAWKVDGEEGRWVGGWVGGWMSIGRMIEQGKEGRRVGGWVGGGITYLEAVEVEGLGAPGGLAGADEAAALGGPKQGGDWGVGGSGWVGGLVGG